MTSRYASENVAAPGPSASRNGMAEMVEWHRRYAEAQRQPRSVTRCCIRCHEPFEIIQRGIRRTAWPRICPGCHAERQRIYLAEWKAQRRAERRAAQASRTCARTGCDAPIPDGRADRQWCSSTCRQAAYRARAR